MKAFVGVVYGGLVALASLAGAVRAEDFSIHLKDEADIDTTRVAPEWRIAKVFLDTGTDPAFEMPETRYEIFLQTADFGNIRLGQSVDLGPSTGKVWKKGMMAAGGADATSIRTGWLHGATDLLIVAWVDDPDPRGNGNTFYHMYKIMKMKKGRAEVLMDFRRACSVRVADFERGTPLEASRFSYDNRRGLLIETISSERHVPGKKGDPLACAYKDETGKEQFSAAIHERITLGYKPEPPDVPKVAAATLVYEAEDGDDLGEIARFYLGPQASRQTLLDVNPDLAAKFKNVKAAEPIRLAAKTPIRIPVAREWFVERCSVTMAPAVAKDAPAVSGSAR